MDIEELKNIGEGSYILNLLRILCVPDDFITNPQFAITFKCFCDSLKINENMTLEEMKEKMQKHILIEGRKIKLCKKICSIN